MTSPVLLPQKIKIEGRFEKIGVKGLPNSSFVIFSGIFESPNSGAGTVMSGKTGVWMINVDMFGVQSKMKEVDMVQIVNKLTILEYPLIYINSDALADKMVFQTYQDPK